MIKPAKGLAAHLAEAIAVGLAEKTHDEAQAILSSSSVGKKSRPQA